MCSTTPKTKAASDALVKAVAIPDKADIISLKKYLVKEYKKRCRQTNWVHNLQMIPQ